MTDIVHAPQGLIEWAETHHYIVCAIHEYSSMEMDRWPPVISNIICNLGQGGLMDLGIELTNKFEIECFEKPCEDGEWFNRIEEFLNRELT